MYENLPAFEDANKENPFLLEKALMEEALTLLERQQSSFGIMGQGDMAVVRAAVALGLESGGLSQALTVFVALPPQTRTRLRKVEDFFTEIKRRHDAGEQPQEFINGVAYGRFEYTPDE